MERRLQESCGKTFSLDEKRISKIGFRPENAVLQRIGEQEQQKNSYSIEGFIKAVLPTGPENIISVMADEKSLYAVSPPSDEFENREPVKITVSMDKVHIFDENGLRV